MTVKKALSEFRDKLQKSLEKKIFVKLTISKPADKQQEIQNLYVRQIVLKDIPTLSITYRHKTQDIVKNHELYEGINLVVSVLGESFLAADLFSTKENITLKYNKKRVPKLIVHKATMLETSSMTHDREKDRFIRASKENIYLRSLGVLDQRGEVNKSMQAKFKQINKYIEIVDGLLPDIASGTQMNIVDMGAGKGYLTFALYDYLTQTKGVVAQVTGIEQRENLVKSCNAIAQKSGFTGLKFTEGTIAEHTVNETDMLIALHACDTATDDAIAKGIAANAKTIIVAPCCHHQIREQMKCNNSLRHILNFGILAERQAEMVTDGLRALLLEKSGYKTKVFEFISVEHTAKNVMIVAEKDDDRTDIEEITAKINSIKTEFGIDYHHLEKRLDEN